MTPTMRAAIEIIGHQNFSLINEGERIELHIGEGQDVDAATLAQIHARALELDVPTQADYQIAIDKMVNETARSKNYNDANALAGYVNSTVPIWASEAQAFVAWRDQVWLYAYSEFEKVMTGQRAQPSVEDMLGELPAIQWPETGE